MSDVGTLRKSTKNEIAIYRKTLTKVVQEENQHPVWVSNFWAVQSSRNKVDRAMERQFALDSECSRTGTKSTAYLLVIGEKTEA